jgi:tetratricopeptide (TPR) repeat protein
VLIGLAQAYEKSGRRAEAEATFRRSIDADPSYHRPHLTYGVFLFEGSRLNEAIAQFRRASEIAPYSSRAFSNLGAVLQLTGDLEGAAAALEKSLEIEPTQLAYINTGTLYFYLGRFQDAEKMYLKSTEMAPADSRTWGNLADTQLQIPSRHADAKRTYERAISMALLELKVAPNDPDTLARLACYYSRIGNHEQARAFIGKALAIPSDSFYVYYSLALAQIEEKELDAAFASLEKAIQLGYATHLVKIGPEFAKLRDDKRFQRLLALTNRQPAG